MVTVYLPTAGRVHPSDTLLSNTGSDVKSEAMYTVCGCCVTRMESLFPSEHDAGCLLKGKNNPKLSVLGDRRKLLSTDQYGSLCDHYWE